MNLLELDPRRVRSGGSSVWGIDVGGANLKICDPSGQCLNRPFPLWARCDRLADAVRDCIQEVGRKPCDPWNQSDFMAVTMTGELADCFQTRRAGVEHILQQLESAIPSERIRVYSIPGAWLSVDEAKRRPWGVAASNWHALARWCLTLDSRRPERFQALIDIGSTTVDIIPLKKGTLDTSAATDRERMTLGQLVYTGMERTPVHAIVRCLRVDRRRCPVMAEQFATILDANLILSALPEQPDNCDTADGRPRTRSYALARLARMVGEDCETLPEKTIVDMARQICQAQARQVARAINRVLLRPDDPSAQADVEASPVILVSGQGRPLIDRLRQDRRLEGARFEFLEDGLGPQASRCATALAVAHLLRNHLDDEAAKQENQQR